MSESLLWLMIIVALAAGAVDCSKNPTDTQGTLRGVATFEGQEDHSGITVQLRELDRRVVTNASGSYSFSSVPAGTYTILAADGDTARHLFDFALLEGVSVTSGRSITAPTMQLPLFQRVESDLTDHENWMAEEGPYLITRSLTIQPGARLRIEPGAVVKFEGYHRLTVRGQLIAMGIATDSVYFTTIRVDGTPGDWDRINIEGPVEAFPDTLRYCHIQFANIGVASSQASPVIRDNSITHCSGYGLLMIASAPEISGNLLRHNYGGISFESGAGAKVETNYIQENDFAGISCTYSSPRITDNIISHNKYGLFSEREFNSLVWHNQFFSNEDAIYLHYYCNPQIVANEISGQHRYGLYLSGYNNPEIHDNNISTNGSFSVCLNYQPDDVQAQNNWWGTHDMSTIGTLIWDGQDDSRLGNVLLDPIREAPVDSAGPRMAP